jgi:hypothetical protein
LTQPFTKNGLQARKKNSQRKLWGFSPSSREDRND